MATKIWKQHRGELLLAACATGVAAGLQFSLNSLSGSLLWVSLPYFIYRVLIGLSIPGLSGDSVTVACLSP